MISCKDFLSCVYFMYIYMIQPKGVIEFWFVILVLYNNVFFFSFLCNSVVNISHFHNRLKHMHMLHIYLMHCMSLMWDYDINLNRILMICVCVYDFVCTRKNVNKDMIFKKKIKNHSSCHFGCDVKILLLYISRWNENLIFFFCIAACDW